MKTGTLKIKNAKTGKCDTIIQYNLEIVDWGLRFFVDTEIEAYKAAYSYRFSPETLVEFVAGAERWQVTVFKAKR